MIFKWLQFNITIFVYKVTNKKHPCNELYKYSFRSYESYCQKIREHKDPFSRMHWRKITKLTEQEVDDILTKYYLEQS